MLSGEIGLTPANGLSRAPARPSTFPFLSPLPSLTTSPLPVQAIGLYRNAGETAGGYSVAGKEWSDGRFRAKPALRRPTARSRAPARTSTFPFLFPSPLSHHLTHFVQADGL